MHEVRLLGWETRGVRQSNRRSTGHEEDRKRANWTQQQTQAAGPRLPMWRDVTDRVSRLPANKHTRLHAFLDDCLCNEDRVNQQELCTSLVCATGTASPQRL